MPPAVVANSADCSFMVSGRAAYSAALTPASEKQMPVVMEKRPGYTGRFRTKGSLKRLSMPSVQPKTYWDMVASAKNETSAPKNAANAALP